MNSKFKSICIILIVAVLIIGYISGCGQRKYEKALDTLLNYSYEDQAKAFEKAGDSGDAPVILDMLQKLHDGEYEEASDAYFSYVESGGKDIDLFTWAANVNSAAEDLKDGGLLKLAGACYRPILSTEWDGLSSIYESLKFDIMYSFYISNSICASLDGSAFEDALASCGTAPDGDVAIYVNDSRKNGVSGFAIGLMSLLPEQIYPDSAAAIEYIIFMDFASETVGVYSDGSGGLQESVHVYIEHCPDGEIVYDAGYVYGDAPPETSIQSGSDTSGGDPNEKETAELIAGALCYLAGGFEGGSGYIIENGEAVLLLWDSAGSEAVIPETLGGYPVTAVAAPALCGDNWDESGNWDITSVVLPDTLTRIGSYSFYYCQGLVSVALPGSLQSIGENAFSGCTALTEISIPGSVESIGPSSFYNCFSLSSVTLGDGIKSIGDNAFSGCSMPDITIPDSVTEIGRYCFDNCPEDLTIVCSQGSAADKYASENGIAVRRP